MKKQTEYKTVRAHNIEWLKNASGNGGAQQIVIDSKPLNNLVIASITEPIKEGGENQRKWADVEPEKLKELLKKDKGIYEIIDTYPFKIYFDIDGENKPAGYYDNIINIINKLFINADIATSGSENEYKKSYHVVLNNYVINNEIEREKLKRVVKYLNKNFDDGFDIKVYGNNRLMKCINQAKPATKEQPYKRIQKIIFNDNYDKHIITAFFNENSKNINDIIFDDIDAPKPKEQKQPKQPQPTPEEQKEQAERITLKTTAAAEQKEELILKLLNILDPARADKIDTFYNLGCLIKSLGLSFEIWYNLSIKSKHFKHNETYNYLLKKWKSIKESRYTINTLFYWARLDNIEEFNNIMIEENFNDTEPERSDIINIESRYLLDNDKKLNDNSILTQNIKYFFETDIYKSLNIKSPYDTGKTQLIKEILRTYERPRVLWVSYRKTLTYDIYGNFHKEFKFSSYLDHKYYADRLIIQIESLFKIDNGFSDEMPKYDLIIIDEIESILNQFNSAETFKGKQRETYNYFDAVLKNSVLNGGKIITLDGDINERTYNFIETYGKPLNIVNNINFNTKRINVINDRNIFNDKLYAALDANKKIVLPVMSEKEAIFLETDIKEKYPNIQVMKYTGKTGDADKAQLKNIIKIWSRLDVIIYTPTIEAGVSFDLERFDVIFGIIADGVASQRSYFQMLARVRKIKEDDIYIYNMNSCKINNCVLWKYENYKQALIDIKDINLKISYEERDGKIIKNYIDPFDKLFIYNKLEELNKNKFQFLTIFKKIALKKGFSFSILEKEKGAAPCENKPDSNIINDIILNTDDINYDEFECLLKKQKRDDADEEEKYKIGKYCIIEKLAVNKLDIDILKTFNKKSYINKYLSLLSPENIKHNTDINDSAPEQLRAHIIKLFLKNIGFKNLASKNKLDGTQLEKLFFKMVKRGDDIFNKQDRNKLLFKTVNKKLDSFKGILGYINTILSSYCLKLSSSRDRAGTEEKITFYELEHLNGIQDIIKFKIMNNYNIKDIDNIIINEQGEIKDKTFTKWGHLRDTETYFTERNYDIIDNENINTLLLDIGVNMN